MMIIPFSNNVNEQLLLFQLVSEMRQTVSKLKVGNQTFKIQSDVKSKILEKKILETQTSQAKCPNLSKSKCMNLSKCRILSKAKCPNLSQAKCANLEKQVTASELEQNIKFNKSSMREAISSLIGQANR